MCFARGDRCALLRTGGGCVLRGVTDVSCRLFIILKYELNVACAKG